MSDYVPIGYTKKVHGTKGELKAHIFDERLEDFLQTEVVFLQIRGKQVPFFIEKYDDGRALLHLEDVTSREEALALTSKELFLRSQDIIPDEEREWEVQGGLEFSYLVGYLVHDKTAGKIGEIEEVLEYPQQEMAVIAYQEKELLVPLNEALFVEIKKAEKELLMNLPEGLLHL